MLWEQMSAWFVGLSYGSLPLAAGLLLQSTVLIGLGLAAGRLVRSKGAALESAVYRTTLVAVILCPVASLLLERAEVKGLALALPKVASHTEDAGPPVTESQYHVAATDPAPIAANDGEWSSGAAAADELAMEDWTAASTMPIVHDPAASRAAVPTAATAPTRWWKRDPAVLVVCLLTAVWPLASSLLLARLLAAHLGIMRLRRAACEVGAATAAQCRTVAERLGVRPPSVRRSPFVTSPCLVGLCRPMVLLPEGGTADGESDRDVLVHEVAHLVRRDHVWNLLGRLSVATLFFQPLLWLLLRRIVGTAEEVCDDYVVDFGFDRRDYARRLADIAERFQPHTSAAGVGMISLRSLLGRRIVRILDGSRRLSVRAGFRAAAATVVVGGMGTLLVGLLAVGGRPADAATDGETAQKSLPANAADNEDGAPAAIESDVVDFQEKPGVEAAPPRAADLAPPVRITAGGKPIDVEGFAAPFVGDFDEDGKQDLLVGQCQAGRLRIYRNVGTNARPKFDRFEWFTTSGGIAGVPICCRAAFTPQLVDFDGDGRTDVLTGEGFGRLYLFRRNQDRTFAEAEVLEDKQGELQMGRHFPSNNRIPYNSTVFAHDWDGDGDADLLFGCYSNCLIPNEGSRRKPVFGDAQPLTLDGEPIPSGIVVGPCVADWDGDGRDDLLAGRKGDIVWYRNTGEKGRPVLQPPEILVAAGDWSLGDERRDDRPARYHAICVADFNADGRLDLLLGDHSVKRVDLTEEQEARIAEGFAASSAMRRELETTPAGETRQQRIERFRKALREWQEHAALPIGSCQAASPRFERHGCVWFYERIAAKGRKEEATPEPTGTGRVDSSASDAGGALEEFLARVERVRARKPGDKPRRRIRHVRNPAGQITGLQLKGAELQQEDFPLMGELRQLETLNLSETNVADEDLQHLAGLESLRELALWDTDVNGSGLAHLGKLDHLERLNLGDAKITDENLRHLKGLENLRYLALNRNHIGDAGLVHLRELRRLEALKLGETEITDEGLRHLKDLKNLRSLTLDQTQITDAGLKYLAELPDFGWISSPVRTAEELVRRLERGEYQAVDDMLTVGLYLVKRGQLRLQKLEAFPQTATDRKQVRHRFRLEMHWTVEAEKLDDTFYAVFAVDRGAIRVHETGILEDF